MTRGSFPRGSGRKRLPSVLRGGPAPKTHRGSYRSRPYPPRGSHPPRGHFRRAEEPRERRVLPSPHQRIRRSPDPRHHYRSSSHERRAEEFHEPHYRSSSHHDDHNHLSQHNHHHHHHRESHEYSGRHETSSRSRERYSPAHYSSSSSNRPSSGDHYRSSSKDRRRDSHQDREREHEPDKHRSVDRRRESESNSSRHSQGPSNRPSNDDTAAIPSALPRPVGSALPRTSKEEPKIKSPPPSSPPPMETQVDERNPDNNSATFVEPRQQRSYNIEEPRPSTSRHSYHRGRIEKSRESVLNRLGPKLRVAQRLGGRGRGFIPRQYKYHGGESTSLGSDNGVLKKKFVKLQCPHCDVNVTHFKDYLKHERSEEHYASLQKLTEHLRYSLARLRSKQRKDQLVIEEQLSKEGKDVDENGEKLPSLYCKTCQLMHHQTESEHEATELHIAITDFLFPTCKICVSKFYSPIAYAQHIATLMHIKKKAYSTDPDDNKDSMDVTDDEKNTSAENPDEEDENFLTLDEIGEVDEIGDIEICKENDGDSENDDEESETNVDKNDESDKKKIEHVENGSDQSNDHSEKTETANLEAEKSDKIIVKTSGKIIEKIVFNSDESKSPKTQVSSKTEVPVKKFTVDPSEPVGQSYIRKVEMFYCDLCHKYLPRAAIGSLTDPEKTVETHCLTPSHQAAFEKQREKEIEEEEKALSELATEKPEEADEDDTLIITTKMDEDDQLDYGDDH